MNMKENQRKDINCVDPEALDCFTGIKEHFDAITQWAGEDSDERSLLLVSRSGDGACSHLYGKRADLVMSLLVAMEESPDLEPLMREAIELRKAFRHVKELGQIGKLISSLSGSKGEDKHEDKQ